MSASNDYDFSKFGLFGDTDGYVLHREVKKLPLLYGNVDREKFWHGVDIGYNNPDKGLVGPEYLSGKERGGVL